MKSKLALLVLSMLAFSSPIHAQSPISNDDKHACTVALCMANPSGPTAAPECRSAMRKLNRDLARGRPVPHCRFLNNRSNNSNNQQRNRR